MRPLPFSFVLHLHQPVGNFDHVFEDHAVDVYRPFFDFLSDHELWPIGVHVSGPLLEWLGDHDTDLHDRLGRLAADGQIELLSAGWYEPVLAALSREDRATQLGWMREELESRFGVTPTGLWLTERVWEPDLPRDLADADIEYVLIDDHLARRAGVCEANLTRPLRTESDGRYLDLLPIDEGLRYLIPFRPAQEIEADLRRRHESGDAMALIGDDAEKFGGWPRTKEWLYEGGWLADFGERMSRLRADDVVRLVTPERLRTEVSATGPVYLPSGSYPEMEEWALGGHWKGFLARYDEANRIHKRMTALSELCRNRGDPPDVRRAIGRGQCNDAYWHGVFGGLYMKHLRQGLRRELLEAERMLRDEEPLAWTRMDLTGSGREGWWAHGSRVSAWVTTDHGGTITDLLWLHRGVDVVDVLTRRREAYHEEAVRRRVEFTGARSDVGEDASDHANAPSIHEIEEASTLERLPPVDRDVRRLLRDRVLPSDLELESYRDGEFTPVWAPESASGVSTEPEAGEDGDGRRTLTWTFDNGPVRKNIEVRDDGRVRVSWAWDPAAFPEGAWFAPELSLGSPVDLAFDPGPDVWRYPIVTTSKCPDGFEEIEQGESITPRWPVELGSAQVVVGAE
ncbi:MAG: DUF1925 domain-containing protein [Gemmatimonadetes bacterium]|nr:DUF1925 domain-containing protein [Gemmatimonadota bacterium]